MGHETRGRPGFSGYQRLPPIRTDLSLQIAGMPTNVPFLKALAAHPSFVAGDVDTGFIGRHRAALIPERLSEEGAAAPAKPLHKGLGIGRVYTEGEKEALAVAAVGLCLQERAALRGGFRRRSYWRRRINGVKINVL